MEEKKISRVELINKQLELIDTINKMIDTCKQGNDKLGVRQYEHLKKQYVKTLFEILNEKYRITIPSIEKKAA